MTYDRWKTPSPDDGQYDPALDDEECPTELDLAYEHIHRLRDLVQTLIDNDPDEPIADNGMTVLDGWREIARRTLAFTSHHLGDEAQ